MPAITLCQPPLPVCRAAVWGLADGRGSAGAAESVAGGGDRRAKCRQVHPHEPAHRLQGSPPPRPQTSSSPDFNTEGQSMSRLCFCQLVRPAPVQGPNPSVAVALIFKADVFGGRPMAAFLGCCDRADTASQARMLGSKPKMITSSNSLRLFLRFPLGLVVAFPATLLINATLSSDSSHAVLFPMPPLYKHQCTHHSAAD